MYIPPAIFSKVHWYLLQKLSQENAEIWSKKGTWRETYSPKFCEAVSNWKQGL